MVVEHSELETRLLSFWNSQTERCGYMDLCNHIVELENIHEDKRNGFEVASIPPEAVALWHTHPSGCPNLSIEDYHLFCSLPNLLHVIVGKNEVAYYFVDTDSSLIRKENTSEPKENTSEPKESTSEPKENTSEPKERSHVSS